MAKDYELKILGIVGSPRIEGNTRILVEEALKAAAESYDAKTELILLAGKKIEPCTACGKCYGTGECEINDDANSIVKKFLEYDGIILGSPVYMGTVTAQLKALMDRTTVFKTVKGSKLKNKVGGGIAVGLGRSGGQETTLRTIHDFFLTHDMIVVGDGTKYGGTAVAFAAGEVRGDELGLKLSRKLGRRVAEVAGYIKKASLTEG